MTLTPRAPKKAKRLMQRQRHGCEYEFLYSFLVHTYNNLRHCRVEQSQFNFESLFAFWHSFNWFDHFENAGAIAAAIATLSYHNGSVQQKAC